MRLLKRDFVGKEVETLRTLLSKKYVLDSKPTYYRAFKDPLLPKVIPNFFDFAIESAVLHFQREEGLLDDGIVGEKTWNALMQSPEAANKLEPIQFNNYIPYFSQRNNANHPNGTCMDTSGAMVASYYGITSSDKNKQLEDELFEMETSKEGMDYYRKNFPSAASKYNVWNIHEMLDWALKKKGLKARTSYTAKDQEVFDYVKNNGPVIISGWFTGQGHIVVISGYTLDGDFIVNDPYGDWNTGYKSNNGEYRIYNKNKMENVWKDKLNSRLAHYITK